MKNRGFRSLFWAVCVFVFACLLVSGAPRLVAVGGEELPPVPAAPAQAYLCSAATVVSQPESRESCAAQGISRGECAAVLSPRMTGSETLSPGADSNGNVLQEASYLRSVHQAFALGDGFA